MATILGVFLVKATWIRWAFQTSFGIGLTVVLLNGCRSLSPEPPEKKSEKPWAEQMHDLSSSLANLLPVTLDPVLFNDPANQALIEQEVTRLAQFSHEISQVKDKPSADPALDFVANNFQGEMSEARRQLRAGNRSYARYLIRNATTHCISCHSQTQRGPQFQFAAGESFSRLGKLERANYLLAVRSYDAGLKAFEEAMDGPDAATESYANLESATLRALAVAIRAKQDPALALRIVNRILKSQWAPVYLQLSAMKWRDALEDWQKHPQPASLNVVKKLLSTAWQKQTETPLSKSGLVETLRASAMLHQILDVKAPGSSYAEILYYAGLTSESLRELDPYSVSPYYYERCVRQAPRTEMAKNCYLRLEALEFADHSQFDAMPLAPSVRRRLEELRQLAIPDRR